ncbi:MAG: hypothetical protein DRQ02_09125 [Candidatus Latescibacterota bacterium]|nr:MAG: hypothetical protein DRQ02_09125 [Candidatus Latescibacterota bacterium]RKY71190.1 MAG: hypothetical protein DRQ24_07880 [Candidatus Latescibacterota bacterium]
MLCYLSASLLIFSMVFQYRQTKTFKISSKSFQTLKNLLGNLQPKVLVYFLKSNYRQLASFTCSYLAIIGWINKSSYIQ